MCLLIVLRGLHQDHPILVASNRDERLDRRSSPPGLWVGRHRRLLSPRDHRAGGSWIAVSDAGSFAGITNIAGAPPPADAPSRGHLVHLALDQRDLQAGIEAVKVAAGGAAYGGFQLVLADAGRMVVVRHVAGRIEVVEHRDTLLVISNEHRPGELSLTGLPAVVRPLATAAQQLEALRPLLLDAGGDGRHAVLKRRDGYGTVSSSLIAVPASDPRRLLWRYAPGPPDQVAYRDYSNLGRRLVGEEGLPPQR